VRADDDYTAYALARWAPLVRTLVLLGLPGERAEDAVTGALARLLPAWSRSSREGDPDLELARSVLDAWVRQRGEFPSRVPVPVPAGRLLTSELEDQLRLLEELTARLDRLDEPTRVAVVTRYVTDLDLGQVADLLGESTSAATDRLTRASAELGLGPLDEVCRRAGGAVEVPLPSMGEVERRAGAARRRAWLVTGAVAVVLGVVAWASFALTRPEPPEGLQALEISPVTNPLGLSWWLDGTLHLEHGTARVPSVRALVDTGTGVVYTDGKGRVIAVSDDGSRDLLGTADPAGPLVSSPRLGLVAWLEPGAGNLVAYDVLAKRTVFHIDRVPGTRIIGWDRSNLYYHDRGADWVLSLDATGAASTRMVRPPYGAGGSTLLDVSAGAQLRDEAGTLGVVQPFFSITRDMPGTTGQLSPDGNYVITRAGEGAPAAYDARTGAPQGTWFKDGWTPVAAAFTTVGRVVWVVDDTAGARGMYECQVAMDYINSFDPSAEPCTPRTELGEELPVLAGVDPGLGPTATGPVEDVDGV